ncbi:MAG: excinuclease ABC subunit UvrA [Balneola sp.]|nr:MAG: excinuclease ABC subunit UvrA [Balneola sp.]
MASTKNGTPTSSKIDKGRPIIVKGARTHNLKNIDVEIPRNKLTVVTGVSGSGKSSLAFDTIYAEGQRRYVESLSSYARQFLERMDKPDVDFMQGISPAMAIQQKTTSSNPRSTVGTTTEIYDYLRLLFARIGVTYSPISGKRVKKDSPRTAIAELFETQEEGARFYVLFPIPKRDKKKISDELRVLKEKGLARLLRLEDEQVLDLTQEEPELKKFKPDAYRVLVDRLVVKDDEATITRIADSLETAFREGAGRCSIKIRNGDELPFSERFELDGMEFTEPTPQMFSFNNPFGACPKCEGFGKVTGIDEDLVIPDHDKTLRNNAISPFDSPKFSAHLKDLVRVASREKFSIDTPYSELPKEVKNIVWRGKDEYIGIWKFFDQVKSQNYKVHMRVLYSRYRGYSRCPECEGYRIRKDAQYVKVGNMHAGEVSELTIGHAREYFDKLELSDFEKEVAGQILFEIRKRLKYLDEVGLDYLTLDRLANTLSGGESQRISLANALGSSLIGSMYVLDEPTIGLHPRDNDRLIQILESLRDIGNTVLVVEHDPEMMKAADNIIDIGPFAGVHGGEVVYAGDFPKLLEADTLTGKFLSGRKNIELPKKRRKGNGRSIHLEGASEHNLKNIDVEFPLGLLLVVTGVSGSGKSTLVHDTLYGGIRKHIGSYNQKVGRFRNISGLSTVHNVEMVDQSPIGRSSRSNPATYTKAFDGIRDVFAATRQAKIMGYTPGHFSFNVPGGRCETCQGEGVQKIEMQFMADIELTCEVCNGTRFRKDILNVKYRGQSIHEVLDMPISEAIDFFVDEKNIINKLTPLEKVGLGYLKLGQSATTLSGGEAQRVKLARFLTKSSSEHTVYFFDEPTTGLHFEDVAKLLDAFNELVNSGHSVIIIEHNLDIIKSADWIIDVGPEGGFGGGQIVTEGTPEDVIKSTKSHTGKYLSDYLKS